MKTKIKSVKGTDLKCPNCDNKWTYKGTKIMKATCPDCNLKISIPDNKVKKKGR